MSPADETKWISAQLEILVLFDALHSKGVLSYGDIQEAIARCRDDLPAGEPYKSLLNIMEQKYQGGRYQSPLASPGDPQP